MEETASSKILTSTSEDSVPRGMETMTCLSCGAALRRPRERFPFCAACVERSRMKKIDPLYDDLGGPG